MFQIVTNARCATVAWVSVISHPSPDMLAQNHKLVEAGGERLRAKAVRERERGRERQREAERESLCQIER
jgi:hypothetical protein